MRIAVIGTGGVGGYFGGRLAQSGHDVIFVARGKHLEALRTKGLSVTSTDGDFSVDPVRTTEDITTVGAVDAMLLGVKTWQVPDLLTALPSLIGPETAVLTTQNGVEAPGIVAEAIGQEHVLPGVAKIFANIEAPGRIRHFGGPGTSPSANGTTGAATAYSGWPTRWAMPG